jgi:phosphate-selective porin
MFSREAGEDALTFRMRRAEFKAQGDIVPELITYSLMIDPARMLEFRSTDVEVEGQEPAPTAPGTVTVQQPASSAPYTVLQDYFITLQSEYVDFSMGQFKIPVSLEGVTSSSKIVFPERSLASRAYGDRREIGLRFEKKIGDYFGYHAGIYHGSGQNRLDNDVDKDAALRLEAYPIEGVTVAAVGYATIGDRDESSRDRLEFDARYDENSILVQGEYIHGWDAAGGGATEGHGWYAMAGYTFLDSIQPVFRYGQVDLDLEADDSTVTQIDAGVNYLFRKHEAKIGLAASFLRPDTGPKHTDIVLAAQVCF